MLVDIRPVDAIARAARFPIRPLLGRCVEQAGIPDERHGDGSAILEIDDQVVIIAADGFNPLVSRWC